jgi:Ni/Co efflux regulator RcnB
MKKVFLLTVLSLGLSTLVTAQDVRQQRDQAQMHDTRGNKPHQADKGHGQKRGHAKQDRREESWREGRHNDRFDVYNARGQAFRRGARIPPGFYNRQYYVNDYRAYRLQPPPRAHQWVQVGPEFVLIAIATGIITNIVLGN